MPIMIINYNWPAVALAMLLGVVLHAIWYSPYVFGGLWARLEGLEDEEVRRGFLPRLGVAVLASAALAFGLAGFFNFTGSNSFLLGALAGLQLTGALALPSLALVLVMGRRPMGLLAVHAGALLLSATLIGGLLGAWR